MNEIKRWEEWHLSDETGEWCVTDGLDSFPIADISPDAFGVALRNTIKRESRKIEATVQPTGRRWERCTPEFIHGGGVCATEPRRALWEHEKQNPDDVGHCHWVTTHKVEVAEDVVEPPRVVWCARCPGGLAKLKADGTWHCASCDGRWGADLQPIRPAAAMGGGTDV